MRLRWRFVVASILRFPSRAIGIVLAIAVGLSAMIFLWAFDSGLRASARNNVIDFITAHIQILSAETAGGAHGWKGIVGGEEYLSALAKDPDVLGYSARTEAEGLAATTHGSNPVAVYGINPASDRAVMRFSERLIEGKYLSSDESAGVLIGSDLSRRLRAKLGDKIVVMLQGSKGEMVGSAFVVNGIFEVGGEQPDSQAVFIPQRLARDFVGIESATSRILVRLKDEATIPQVLARLQPLAARNGESVMGWQQLAPEQEQWARWFEMTNRQAILICALVIAAGIVNILLLSVLERTREFGIMLAIGTSPRQIFTFICMEVFILLSVGIGFGLALGSGLVHYYHQHGMRLEFMDQAFKSSFVAPTIYPTFSPDRAVESILVLSGITFLSALLPALRAARLQPIKAIYYS